VLCTATVSASLSPISAIAAKMVSVPSISLGPMIGLAWDTCLLLRFSLLWAGIYFGLLAKSPEAAGASWALLFPLTMLVNTFASPELMPGWLGAIANWNPLSATVTATRELFKNPGVGGDSWATENSMLLAVAWPILLMLIFAPLAVRRYRNRSI